MLGTSLSGLCACAALLLVGPLPASGYITASHTFRTAAVARFAAIHMESRSPKAAAEIGQLLVTSSPSTQKRAQEAAENTLLADQVAADANKADQSAKEAYLGFLEQHTAADDGQLPEAAPSEANQLLQRIKDAGVAGAVAPAMASTRLSRRLPIKAVASRITSRAASLASNLAVSATCTWTTLSLRMW